jgi:hypothetical protein
LRSSGVQEFRSSGVKDIECQRRQELKGRRQEEGIGKKLEQEPQFFPSVTDGACTEVRGKGGAYLLPSASCPLPPALCLLPSAFQG